MSVTDTGIGIRREHHQKVFDKFFQVDSSKTRRYEGTGIGLSIAKTIVEAHGGTIGLDSEEGKGCTFTVSLPNSVFDPEWKRDSLSNLSNLDVLVVDEGEAFPRALAYVLSPLGINYRRATNGYQCVRELERKQPDLILLNDTVNDIAGLSTLTLLRQNLTSDTVPVIAFSGASGERLREADNLWGDIYFVSKPFTAQDLADALHVVCNNDDGGIDRERRSREREGEGVLAKILVVDTDPGLLDWVDTAMAHRHVLAYCAAAPAQAMELLQIERPGLMLVDVDVPGASISEQLEELLPCARSNGVPLYVMTGLPQRSRLPQGVAGCIRKPFTTDELMVLVQKHIIPGPAPVEGEATPVAVL
jgi:DNA-binding response OmpR family regulator